MPKTRVSHLFLSNLPLALKGPKVIPALKPKLLQSLTVLEIRTKPFFASGEKCMLFV